METVKVYVDKILLGVTATLFLIMVAVTTWQVIARYILSNPSTITEEFIRFSLIWLSMLAASYVVGKRSHIAFTMISDRFKGKNKVGLELFIQSAFLLFSLAIMTYGGVKAISITMSQLSPSLGIPMGYVYLSLPVSGLLITFYSIVNMAQLLTKYKTTAMEKRDSVEYEKAGEVL